jgi:acyl-CoA synthetase (AMP-forming)/AMP-acid ligase II
MTSISRIVRQNLEAHPNKMALTESLTGRSVTWVELNARIDRVAGGLAAGGVGRGDRVAFLGHNCIEMFEILFGAAKLGATFVPLNWNLNVEEIRGLVEDLGAVLCFADPTYSAGLDGAIEVGDSFSSWREASAPWDGGEVGGAEDVVVQPYTSGTTGVPKGVMHTNGTLGAFFESAQTVLQYNDSASHLLSLPNYHIGVCTVPLLALLQGGAVVMTNRFVPAAVLDAIESYGVTHINLVPTMINMLIEDQLERPRDLSSMRLIIYGAAPVTPTTVARAKDVLRSPLVQLYASTEAIMITVLGTEDHEKDLLSTVGVPFPGVTVAIRDPETGRGIATGERGQIFVKSGQVTTGYWRRPEESVDLFTSDGFIRTGDLGFVDKDGYLSLSGRVKDMIITAGENIYPAEVEEVLVRHYDVREVAVVGIPDERWGEVVTAFVVTQPGSTVTPADLTSWAYQQLGGYRRPRSIEIVTALPRNLTGKLERITLRENYLARTRSSEERPK